MYKTKDIEWGIDGRKYLVRNVPHINYVDDGEDYLDSGVCEKLLIIKDLMVSGDIPIDIDFNTVEGIDI